MIRINAVGCEICRMLLKEDDALIVERLEVAEGETKVNINRYYGEVGGAKAFCSLSHFYVWLENSLKAEYGKDREEHEKLLNQVVPDVEAASSTKDVEGSLSQSLPTEATSATVAQ